VETETGWGGAASIAEIKAAVKAYIDDLPTGHDVIYEKIIGKAIFITGVYDIASCVIDFTDPPATSDDLAVSAIQYVTVDLTDIDVVAV
jgi:hypothetical protein